MTVIELNELLEGTLLTPDNGKQIKSGFTCDLLSWVMAHGSEGMAWITVQTHMNVIAVATLHDMSCVIIPDGNKMEADVAQKAAEEGVAVISTTLSAFEACGRMYSKGIKA